MESLIPKESVYTGEITGKLITSKKPIPPSSGMRGISLYSRGKLVNAPEFFSNSTSSYFYQYLTGWIHVDFIDLLPEDVISTNRQSIDWEHPEMAKLRDFLSELISKVNIDWREKRKEQKEKDLKKYSGIDTEKWMKTLPEDIQKNTQEIFTALNEEESVESHVKVKIVTALHGIVPEYPLLHWRHLHSDLKQRVESYYENNQFPDAASQGVQVYYEKIRDLTGLDLDGSQLTEMVFGGKPYDIPPKIQLNSLTTKSEKNLQEGQALFSKGITSGFRNPISHRPIDRSVPSIFTELDCLHILSLISYLMTRLDKATVNP